MTRVYEPFEGCTEEEVTVLDCIARGLDADLLNIDLIEELKNKNLLSHLPDGTITVPAIVWKKFEEYKEATGWHSVLK